MRWGISGQPLPAGLRYATEITQGCKTYDFPPCFAYAIAWRESISGEVNGLWPSAAAVISADGGHGLFQLTSYVPSGWDDPLTNCKAALQYWLLPNVASLYEHYNQSADALVKAAADAFNRGYGAVTHSLDAGADPDVGSAHDNYGSTIVDTYHRLIAGNPPA